MKRLVALAVPIVMWSAMAATPALAYARALVTRGRGTTAHMPVAGHGATSVGLVIVGVAILAVAVGGIVYAIVADRRRGTPPARGEGEPVPLLRDRSEAGDQHKAA
jgi:hypothetical protein